MHVLKTRFFGFCKTRAAFSVTVLFVRALLDSVPNRLLIVFRKVFSEKIRFPLQGKGSAFLFFASCASACGARARFARARATLPLFVFGAGKAKHGLGDAPLLASPLRGKTRLSKTLAPDWLQHFCAFVGDTL
jgi:hypothetical protein